MSDTATKVAQDSAEQSGGQTAKPGAENPGDVEGRNHRSNELDGPQLTTSANSLPSSTVTGGDTSKHLMNQPDIALDKAVTALQSKLSKDHPGVTVKVTKANGEEHTATQPQPLIDPTTQKPVDYRTSKLPAQSQLDERLAVNQQNTATLLAPDSAPEEHKTYHWETRGPGGLLTPNNPVDAAADSQPAEEYDQAGEYILPPGTPVRFSVESGNDPATDHTISGHEFSADRTVFYRLEGDDSGLYLRSSLDPA